MSPTSASVSLASTLPDGSIPTVAFSAPPASAAAGATSATATGASLTLLILNVNVRAMGSRLMPPFAVPPLSRTWKVNDAAVGPFGVGVNTRRVMSADSISWPTVTATPFKRKVPLAGNVVRITDCMLLAGTSRLSEKPKSAELKVHCVDSAIVTVLLVPVGASLTAVMVRARFAVEVAVPSVTA